MNNIIPKILHQSSHNITWEEKYLVRRNKKIMPDWRHFMWNNEKNDKFVKKFYPQYEEDYFNIPQGVMRIDIVRCLYLHKYGGVYCDTDYIFIKPIDNNFLKNTCVLGIEEYHNKWIDTEKVGNAFLASAKGYDMWTDFVENIFENYKKGEKHIVKIGGPHALSLFLSNNNQYKQHITTLPQNILYPDFQLTKILKNRNKKAYGIHLCWGSWRNKNGLQRYKNHTRRIVSAYIASRV